MFLSGWHMEILFKIKRVQAYDGRTTGHITGKHFSRAEMETASIISITGIRLLTVKKSALQTVY